MIISVDKEKLVKAISHEMAKQYLLAIGYIESEEDMFTADGSYRDSILKEVELSQFRVSKIVDDTSVKTTTLTPLEHYHAKKFLELRSKTGGYEAMAHLMKLNKKSIESYERVKNYLSSKHCVEFI